MRLNGVILCDNCKREPATKRHRAGNFFYCDQCVFDLALRDVVGLGQDGDPWRLNEG